MEFSGTVLACAFLRGDCADDNGRYIFDYRKFTPEQMETEHGYIQWMFPTDQPSKFNPSAPLLGRTTTYSPPVQNSIRTSILQFTGWLASTEHWRKPLDHNLLRITRMLRSTKLILGDDAAQQLLAIMCEFRGDFDGPIWAFTTHETDKRYVADYWEEALK